MCIQSCPTLWNPMDFSPPDSCVHGIFQARIPEWVATHFLLQGIFLSQWLNPGLLHYRQILYQLSHQGIPCCCCCCQVISAISNSVRPHRWEPTRLPHPWDSQGKNTGVGCHFLLQCVKSIGWCKRNGSFALLNFGLWYWNIFLNKYGYVIHHFNVHLSLCFFANHLLLAVYFICLF